MMEVIPAINCEDFACVQKHLEMLKNIPAEWVHFDVSDGTFNPARTWNEPEDLISDFGFRISDFSLEAHLMVREPVQYVERWVRAGARRVLVQVEVLNENTFREIEMLRRQDIDISRRQDVELGLVLNPETPVETVFPYLDKIRFVQLLAVTPGFSGQKFQENVLEKIRTLRARDPHVIIEADGGITLDVAGRVKEAGANVLVSSSYIWNSSNSKEAFRTLQEV
ncbi:MAG: hypothetical protein Q8P01_00310 [bacterium]|nr:hypothetical protein [bacterium]